MAMDFLKDSHSYLFLQNLQALSEQIHIGAQPFEIDGSSLDIPKVVAVARHGARIIVSSASMQATAQSAEAVRDSLAKKQIVYGVNTGFGGSANTRTQGIELLQRELMRGLHYGVLVQPKSLTSADSPTETASRFAQTALPLDDPVATTSMPESWVRASMLIRLNSLASGASGVKISTIETLAQLLEKDIVPRIPLRGSISASGDLSPLSYLGGLMQGKPSITAWTGRRSAGDRRIQRADHALAESSISPIKLGAKEGLAIVNGTSLSAGVAALAMQEAHCQAALSQVLTAMTVESLRGTDESYDQFFAQVRPHPGQRESARNIYAFLKSSQLVYRNDGSEASSMRQDRYSIRTASQWIGPVLEDLLLAHQQVTIEINSVTDNPLVDTSSDRMLHGGNFQAKAVTSAMEKVRQGCQSLGRMLSVQCTEMINPATNRGLPPNLVVDEPSESFLWKGIDIMVAALQSELGFLANPVGTHVQTAEMGNQALNSLALISARYTLDALQVLTQLSAAHLLALCQALDLRAMNLRFLERLSGLFTGMLQDAFCQVAELDGRCEALSKTLWALFTQRFDETTGIDCSQRFQTIAKSLQPTILQSAPKTVETLTGLNVWTSQFSASATDVFNENRDDYVRNPVATPYLGMASARMYTFVRTGLKVPFLHEATIATPDVEIREFDFGSKHMQGNMAQASPSMGGFVTTVYESMRSGELYMVVGECLQTV